MQFLTPKTVCKLTSLSRSTLDRIVASGDFPQPVRITQRRLAYRADEVEAWMAGKEQRREAVMQELADEAQELGLGY